MEIGDIYYHYCLKKIPDKMKTNGLCVVILSFSLLFIINLIPYHKNIQKHLKNLFHSDFYETSQNINQCLLNNSGIPKLQKLIYNRVPKCGSRTMRMVIQKLGNINKYHVTNVQFKNIKHWIDSTKELDKIQKDITALPKPWIYIRHIYFMDFNDSGTVRYINLIRDPLHRLVSLFYYIRRKSHIHRYGNPPDDVMLTFDECVKKNYSECQQPYIFQIIPYFCGHDARCTTPSTWALEKAKQNVERNFLVVGYLENVTEFLDVVEHMWPQFFRNAKELYIETVKRIGTHKTYGKVQPLNCSIALMRERLRFEYEFYYFVKRHFDCLYSKLFST